MTSRTHVKAIAILASVGLAASCGDVIDGSTDSIVMDSIAPASGPQEGGTVVTVTGSGFTADDGDHFVAVGDTVVPATLDSDTTITFTTPPGVSGNADVTLLNFRGSATLPHAFRYNDSIEVFDIEPRQIAGTGGPITVFGAGFAASSNIEITIGGAMATDVQVVDGNTLTAMAAPRADPAFQEVDVVVSSGDGTVVMPRLARYSEQGLLLSDQQGRLEFVDVTTGRTGHRLELSRNFRKIAIRPDGTGLGFEGNSLFDLDLNDNSSRHIGRLRDNMSANLTAAHIAFDASNNAFVFLKRNGGVLATLDTGTGVATPIGTADPGIPGPSTGGSCVFENNAQTFFFIGPLAAGLQTISKSNSSLALVSALSNVPTGVTSCREAAVLNGTTYLLLYTRTPVNGEFSYAIVSINTTTGALTTLAEFSSTSRALRSLNATPTTF